MAAARDVPAVRRRAAVRSARRPVRERRSARPEPDCLPAVVMAAAGFSAEAGPQVQRRTQPAASEERAALQPAAPAARDAAAMLRREARDAAEEPQPEEVAAQDAAEEPRQEAAARAEVLPLAAVLDAVGLDAAVPLRVAPGAQAVVRPSAAAWASHRDRLHRPAPSPAARFPHAMTGQRIAAP
jgi:hypothetical protein